MKDNKDGFYPPAGGWDAILNSLKVCERCDGLGIISPTGKPCPLGDTIPCPDCE